MSNTKDYQTTTQEILLRLDQNIKKATEISPACLADVQYLRTRVRHTLILEDKLIELHEKGTPPNVMEFGCPSQAMKNKVKELCEKYEKNDKENV